MKTLKLILLTLLVVTVFSCQESTSEQKEVSEPVTEIRNDIEKVEPPNWWIDFKNKNVQLLVKHPSIGNATAKINYSGVSLVKTYQADSPNYLFLDLEISEAAKAGQFNITFKLKDGSELTQTYELKSREKSAEDFKGFNSSDAIYLITPDRFANAIPNNDSVEGLLQQGVNRTDDYARHGGDIQGITDHLDYIEDLGFTAVWPCPVVINDMPSGSYHGYAMTDFYKVDPRFGTLEEYRKLADDLRSRDMKLIMDQVANHCGLEHWWMKDLPFKDWVNYQENYEKNRDNWDHKSTKTSSHRRTTNQDLYASKSDYQEMADGWFVSGMPDLNQRNPFMANYIIQNSIWWVETLGLGGIRQDTYPYPDKTFMSDWAGSIMTEYPNFSIVGEEWSYNPLLIGYWQDGKKNKDGYKSNLKSTMDFAMQKHIVDALNEEESWDQGLVKMYEGLANDFAYASPKDIMAFLDNHDKSRVFTEFKGNIANTKMALSYLLMMPRIPQIYYGTEILMDDFDNPGDHGLIRTDFPGGWEGDSVNAFTGEGLSAEQKDMQSFLTKVLNYRKSSEAIHDGKTKHFAPENGIYVLARISENETVVHIINKNESPQELDLSRFEELELNGKSLKNIISRENITWSNSLKLSSKGSLILTTKF
ncbi:glycoside hydrolase family 13 protein [Winogradskyella bathintestinalis]|uniref:Glycoside hydrolase family 13 protein n=1 Tax=Winogradskyella bathintestinalis TaxID=3035208 RepID=A0ABT7ZQD4_9FLAO|nr:glycoside hydrolase family 13 protein [Winogradskyella bathintestinalis]MDN3491219.1 glycoside hydrolase family 13 protein [Winogradskyella bathintestinalis]